MRISALLSQGVSRACLEAVSAADAGYIVLTMQALKDELQEVIRRKSLVFTAEQSAFYFQMRTCERLIDPSQKSSRSAAIRTTIMFSPVPSADLPR